MINLLFSTNPTLSCAQAIVRTAIARTAIAVNLCYNSVGYRIEKVVKAVFQPRGNRELVREYRKL